MIRIDPSLLKDAKITGVTAPVNPTKTDAVEDEVLQVELTLADGTVLNVIPYDGTIEDAQNLHDLIQTTHNKLIEINEITWILNRLFHYLDHQMVRPNTRTKEDIDVEISTLLHRTVVNHITPVQLCRQIKF